MDIKWNSPLKPHQSANPVVFSTIVDLPDDVISPTDEELAVIFPTPQYKLQTWKRSVDVHGKTIMENDEHWIGVRRGTPLHTDPRYPRYSHQLKVRVDEGIFCRGMDRGEIKLTRGLFYILDTHSPHQVFSKEPGDLWNVSASIDSKNILDPQEAIGRLISFAQTDTIL